MRLTFDYALLGHPEDKLSWRSVTLTAATDEQLLWRFEGFTIGGGTLVIRRFSTHH